MMNGRGKSDSGIVPAKPVNAASHRRTWSQGEPYSGETPETANTLGSMRGAACEGRPYRNGATFTRGMT